MFLENLEKIPDLSRKTSFSIFVADVDSAIKILKKAYKSSVSFLSPDEKTGKISVDSVRDFVSSTNSVESSDRFFVITFAECLNPAAENALLKNLEEPKPRHHFILLTTSPSSLLPTVLSRAQIYFEKESDRLSAPIKTDEKTKALAKQLIVADEKGLIALGNDLSKKKDNPRRYALAVVGTAIEILYKSYFATNQEKYLKKLPNLLKTYENLEKNGHIKLHLVADML